MADDPTREPAERRLRDLARTLPVLGALALMPPFVALVAGAGGRFLGMPGIVVYLFGLWLALIAAAFALARALGRADARPPR